MAFQETGKEEGGEKIHGLPFAWENLERNSCPRCSDNLSLFEHVSLYKCFCGFKISVKKYSEIIYQLRDGDTFGNNSGYRLGKYHDESPF